MTEQNRRACRRKAVAICQGTLAAVVLACWVTAGCALARKQPKAVAAPDPGPSDQAAKWMEQNQVLSNC